jgi:hypothetical protein
MSSLFKEEDSTIFTETLKLYYDFFVLLNNSLEYQFKKDRNELRIIMNDFTFNFNKYFFAEDLSKPLFV